MTPYVLVVEDEDALATLLDYNLMKEGFRVEGPLNQGLDYSLMRYAANEFALPDRANTRDEADPELQPTLALLGDSSPKARAELHSRLTPPLLALAFALMTLPLGRSSPRQARYGRIMLGFLVYIVATNLMFIGASAIAKGSIPPFVGLWWLSLPMLAAALWFYFNDGRMKAGKIKA